MSKNKTQATSKSVEDFVANVENEERRKDSQASLEFYNRITNCDATLWGPSLIGYGSYHYVYESGREGDFFRAGFSPRKASMTYYLMAKFNGFEEMLEKLGKHKMTKSCLYIKRLADVDQGVLEEIICASYLEMNKKYPQNAGR